MDHKQAVDLQLAVKYVLGELPPVQRDEYEDHYIDCPECAKDVYAAAAFTDTTREVFRQEAQSEVLAPARPRVQSRWFAWLRPVVAVPAMAALLMVVAYQNVVTIPRAKQVAAQGAGQVVTSVFSLQMANTRGGGEEVKVRVRPSESFALRFDFTPAKAFGSYLCQLQDQSGRSIVEATVSGTSINQEAQFVVPAGRVRSGEYTLVFTGEPGSGSTGSKEEVLRLRFAVEF